MSTIFHGKRTTILNTSTLPEVSEVNCAGDNDTQMDEFRTNVLLDEELMLASQEIETALEQIDHFKNPGQVIDLPLRRNSDGTLSLSTRTCI